MNLLTKEFLKEYYSNRQMTLIKIAKEVGVNIKTVRKYLEKHKIPIRTNREAQKVNRSAKLTKELLWKRYIEQEMSTCEISKEVGSSNTTVLNCLKEYNIPIRTSSEINAKRGIFRKDITGQEHGSLTVIKYLKTEKKRAIWLCKCDCGRYVERTLKALTRGNAKSKSCRHCNDPKIGDTYGRLTITKVIPNKYKGCQVETSCECGGYWRGKPSRLRSGNNKSCGNCCNMINGKPTSEVAKALDEQIQDGFYPNTIHNYQTESTNIDIYIPEINTCVEYDGWHWHGNKPKRDEERNRALLKLGYKLLIIKGNNFLPTKEQLETAFEKLTSSSKQRRRIKYTITLEDWGKGLCR